MKLVSKFGIPARVLGVVVTVGCGAPDPMIGDFICTYSSLDGQEQPCPFESRYVENGVTYDLYGATTLSLQEDGTGVFVQIEEVMIDGTLDEGASYTETFNVSSIVVATGAWNLSIPTFYGLDLACRATTVEVRCLGDDLEGEQWEYNFARVAP